MRGLIGYLKKILFLSSILALTLSLAQKTSAAEPFQIYTSFEHKIESKNISTEAILQIRSDSPRVISYYTASIPQKNLDILCYLVKTNKRINCTTFHRGSNTDVLLELNNAVVKKDAPLEVMLRYKVSNESSNAFNISSKILDTTTSSALIQYPKTIGEPLWTSDPLSSIKAVKDSYQILINKPIHPTISILFGEKVSYKFSISRNLQNTTEENQTFELIVLPDTKDQTVIWTDISPLPNSAVLDENGNYVFKYIVPPSQSMECKIDGYVEKIISEEKEKGADHLTKPTGYWKIVNSSEWIRVQTYMKRHNLNILKDFDDIESLKTEEKEIFYKALYKYVVEKLNFNKNLTLGIETTARLGANILTESALESAPIDYADFYIALLRHYKIPSRMVIGYISEISGYTADGFYHYWVEYYDSTLSKWIIADPFLSDYLNKDLFKSDFFDHITVLKRGKSSVSPNITFYSENDFKVEFSPSEKEDISFLPTVELTFEKLKSTDQYLKGYLYILNSGNIAINSHFLEKSNIENIRKYIDPVNNIYSKIILPKQSATIQLNIPYNSIRSSNIFLNLTLANNSSNQKNFLLEQNVTEILPIYILIISKIISISVFLVGFFLIYFGIKKIRKHG